MRDIKDISDVIFCVIDRGTFFPVAERLSREAKRVYYHKPAAESFDTAAQFCLGWGHEKIVHTDDIWSIKHEVDCFVFPDCKDGGLQVELESQGFSVWGSKNAGPVEENRGKWIDMCEELGFSMPHTEILYGLSQLRAYLKEREGEALFVKVSRFRGDMETWQTESPQFTQNKLDYLAMRFGPLQEHIAFYVQEPVETDIEAGSDTYNIFGQYPDEIILGYEKKDLSYLATVKKASEMPDEVWGCSKHIASELRQFHYANFISSEVRIKDKETFWLDPCFRCPSPAGEEQLEMYKNFPLIVYLGGRGILVQPEWEAKFCGEACIKYTGDKDAWKSVAIPEGISRWIKLYACAYADGYYHFPTTQDPEVIGCAVGVGDTPEDVIDHLKALAEVLKDQPVELGIVPMADLITEIAEAEKTGVEFTDEPMPKPESVIT